jgi:hypothetical protein
VPSPIRRKKLRLKKKRTKSKAATSSSGRSRGSGQQAAIAQKTAQALPKKPADMTAADISRAITEIETQIENGKALLPADASLLQRALFALKLALLKAGDVDPELAVKNKKQLEQLIAEKRGQAPVDAATQAAVTQAVNDVKAAQAQVQNQQAARGETISPSTNDVLDRLKTKSPDAMTAEELSTAIAEIDQQIENGKALLPADASLLQRALFALKLALLNAGGVDPELAITDREQLEQLIAEKRGQAPADAATQAAVTQAMTDVKAAQAQVQKQQAARGETVSPSTNDVLDRLKTKSPDAMTAEELSTAIAEIDQQIENSKVLLPADASLLQRALYTLKLALLRVGGVDPELAVQDRERLEQLITEKHGNTAADAATQASFTQAVNEVKTAQAQTASRHPIQPSASTSNYSALDRLKQTSPEDLSTAEIEAAISDIDRSIADSKVLLPENASPLLRALYALKLALLELGNGNPQRHYDIQDHLKTILQERMANGLG